MRTFLPMLLASSGLSMAVPTIYQEENFSIEFPTGWEKAEAPPEALALVRSPDGAKGVVLMAFKIPAGESSSALKKMVAGAKGGAIQKGIPITGERDQDINGVAFHIHAFTLPNGVANVSNMAVAGDRGYSVQGFSGTSDPSADPEIQGVIHSFRLLAPVAAVAAPSQAEKSEGAAFKAGRITGRIAVIAFVVGAIVIMLQRLAKGKKTSP